MKGAREKVGNARRKPKGRCSLSPSPRGSGLQGRGGQGHHRVEQTQRGFLQDGSAKAQHAVSTHDPAAPGRLRGASFADSGRTRGADGAKARCGLASRQGRLNRRLQGLILPCSVQSALIGKPTGGFMSAAAKKAISKSVKETDGG